MQIYKITNRSNGKVYVGQTVGKAARRWAAHKSSLRNGKHQNSHLQSSWNKHGEDNFSMGIIIERCGDSLDFLERRYIAEYDCTDPAKGYNNESGGNDGKVVSAVSRAKMSASAIGNTSHKGHVHTPEAKAKMSAASMGNIPTDETRAKLSAVNIGRVHTSEAKANMSAAKMGHVVTVETRAKISVAGIGNTYSKGYIHTAETRAKMSAAAMGKVLAAETRAKISKANKGKAKPTRTAEHSAKISAAHIARHAKKRAELENLDGKAGSEF